MESILLTANADYGQAGQYVARITGRDPKFTFEREFIGRKLGKRGETTQARVDEPGLYEVRDATRKGKRTRYELVLRNEAGELEVCRADEDDAMRVARELGEGKPFESIVHVEPDAWVWGPRPAATATATPPAGPRAEALAEIRRLMAEHAITPDDLR